MEKHSPSFFLRSLKLAHFRNYDSLDLDTSHNVVCITGLNGSGKTNLLDAIYYTCFTKSYFHFSDQLVVQHEAPFLRIEAAFEKKGQALNIAVKLPRGGKKVFSINGEELEKVTAIIGQLPAVLVAPDDNKLILGSSDERRRFFDATLSQAVPGYLEKLLTYQKLIMQRNAALKEFAASGNVNTVLLDTYDAQLSPLGDYLWTERRSFMEKWLQVFVEQYQNVVEAPERPGVIYSTPSGPFAKILQEKRSHDIRAQRTTCGPHTDDLEFLLDDHPVKKTGSQGQQKSFVVALKMAQWKMLSDLYALKPILLLDDIFDKLDLVRIKRLMELVKNGYLGQVFITDTDAGRMEKLFRESGIEAQMIGIKKGKVERQHLSA